MSDSVHVAVAIIANQQNEILISLRSNSVHQGGLWEFPGGKLEPSESTLDALKREIKEELNISILKASPYKKIKYQYSDKTVLLDIWWVESFSGNPEGAEAQQIKWQAISRLNENEFPAANKGIIMSLQLPQKYMITGAFESHQNFKSKLETSLKKGISIVQLRCKKISETEYKQLAEISINLCKKYNAILLFNTSVEIFKELSANTGKTGLHLNSQMLDTIQIRPIEADLLLSVSCHNSKEIEKAKQLDADIILLSPVKETRSHPGVKGIGWNRFLEIANNINAPVYALGGMSEADLADAKQYAAQGVAAISGFWG